MTWLRQLIIRFITPLIWRASEKRKINALQEFSFLEKDSSFQLLGIIGLLESPKNKAIIFQSVLEEFFHADIFADIASLLSDEPLSVKLPLREELLPDNAGVKEVRDLIAYVHVGERDINSDFDLYAKASLDRRIQNIFRRASADEGKHVDSTEKMLLGLSGGHVWLYRWTMLKADGRRLYKQFTTYSKSFGVLPLTLILTFLYFLFGITFSVFARRRLRLSREAQLKIIQDQQRNFEIPRSIS